ncbi:MAG: 23S rRNA (adenine(2503)-C(2))-methyltransferase RlmN [Opitutaceae bacterium]|nr:23S rRNA (adenine(2503)-C(2))-methyltransferase RlmN [Opitutaceae bacterium]
MGGPLRHFYDLTRDEIIALVASWDFSPVHAVRLWSYVYHDGVDRFAAMPEVPARLRARLEGELSLARPPVALETLSADGFTRKYLLALADGPRIETVLMRYTGRVTACISSQAGCAMGCGFCATGQMGFVRHLTPGEIVTQVLHIGRVLRRAGPAAAAGPARVDSDSPHARHERLRNVVLMGMGEPLHNYEAVMRAVDILRDQNGPAIGAKRITLSTVGVIPGIVRLADEARPIQLAVSLHAATQAERAALVPVAARWPLAELIKACRYYVEKQQRRIFFEWTLIAGRNDTPEQAHAVGRLLRGLQAQVNLIPLNPTAGYGGVPSDRDAARRFQEILAGHGLPSTVRQRRGLDIAAGCGQLAGGARPP